MLALWLLCLVGMTAAVPLHRSPADDTACQPGTVWMADDGCNTCFCTSDGQPGCTRIDCEARAPPSERAFSDFFRPMPPPPPPEQTPLETRTGVNCTVGDDWREQCNKCACMEEGVAICTNMSCGTDRGEMADRVRERCVEGDMWSDDCNLCHCVGGSQVVCSHFDCPPQKEARTRRQAGCTPGTERQADCNTCLCMANGLEACTRRFCLPEATRARVAAGRSCSTQLCPADCGERRDDDGCLVCLCGPEPFFGTEPPVPTPGSQSGPQTGLQSGRQSGPVSDWGDDWTVLAL